MNTPEANDAREVSRNRIAELEAQIDRLKPLLVEFRAAHYGWFTDSDSAKRYNDTKEALLAAIPAEIRGSGGKGETVIHLRIDDEDLNSRAKFACGLVGVDSLPKGDKYVSDGEYRHHWVTCVECGGGEYQIGTPISELSGQPGQPGYGRFKEIARSWGYD